MSTRNGSRDTVQEILDVAEALAQSRGYNGFSYADISHAVGITKASLHYHFPTKEALGQALMDRYTDRFREALAAIRLTAAGTREMVERYVRLYRDVLVLDRMCLCGMLAAEVATLPPGIQDRVRTFFDVNERWLSEVFELGLGEAAQGEQQAREAARLFLSALEGSMLVARSYAQPARFEADAERLIRLYLGTLLPLGGEGG